MIINNLPDAERFSDFLKSTIEGKIVFYEQKKVRGECSREFKVLANKEMIGYYYLSVEKGKRFMQYIGRIPGLSNKSIAGMVLEQGLPGDTYTLDYRPDEKKEKRRYDSHQEIPFP